MQFFLFLAFIITVLFVIVTFQNPGDIPLIFINWEIKEPAAVVLAIPFAAGLIVGLFLFIPLWWRKSKLARTNKKRVQELEEELSKAQDQVEEMRLAEEETPEEVDYSEEENKGPGDIY